MSTAPVSIPRTPALTPSADFYALRRTAIGYIEELASRLWTDYNPHDPGITLLEQLCFALTDLAYRNGWDIKDLLMPPVAGPDPAQPYPDQAFFTARDILTVDPVTSDDYRRLLIGRAALRNAWLSCKECACDVAWYASCVDGRPVVDFGKPGDDAGAVRRVQVRGLYDVLLELEEDAELGDLNDRKIWLDGAAGDGANAQPFRLELRFPDWEASRPAEWRQFVDSVAIAGVTLAAIGARPDYDLLTDPTLDDAGRDAYLRTHWNRLLWLTFDIAYPSGPALVLPGVALHFFGTNAARARISLARVQELLEASLGAVGRYREKLRRAETAVRDARATLSAHRNLDEDFCRVAAVAIEDVAVCADIDAAPGADIERLQAQAWFAIERYFNPPIAHYTLREMLAAGLPVEDIFNGPPPEGGFLRQDEVEAARLRTALRNSDLINLLMDIDGVVAVRGLLLSKYDERGEIVKGAADPVLVGGNPVFDPAKGSAAWELYLAPLHQPRLYFERSRMLFFKDGLPFLPRADEAMDSLRQLRAEAERARIDDAQLDLPIPSGTYRPAAHYPLQYGLPQVYGVGPAGLPASAGVRRQGQARQLQAYLIVFEQLLANAGAQLAHGADLFSLDPAVARTCFAARLGPDTIADYDTVVDSAALDDATLAAMTETRDEFLERRNRMLDHLLARFGESFDEYALLLTRGRRDADGLRRLIDDKIGFLRRYPAISRARAHARDIHHLPLAADNVPGVQRRVALLLGYPDLDFAWTMSGPAAVGAYALEDARHVPWLAGTFAAPIAGGDDDDARQAAWHFMLRRLSQPGAWRITTQAGRYTLRLDDADGNEIGATPVPLDTLDAARALLGELAGWGSHRRTIVVEHLLLRPKFPGDALMAPCPDDECGGCCESDPYSFRLGIVIPAWTAPFDADMDLRAFADRTIRRELPAHLLAKVCWVGNDGFAADLCAPVVVALAELLEREGLTEGGERPDPAAACACANALYLGFADVFAAWYEDRTLDYHHADALRAALQALFDDVPPAGDFTCAAVLGDTLFAKVRAQMVAYFVDVAWHGWQFERFEAAWRAWVVADAPFDWGDERLPARVEAILAEALLSPQGRDALCGCTARILVDWGAAFDAWLRAGIASGLAPDALPPFDEPEVTLCAGLTFEEGCAERIAALLRTRYQSYVPVSYRLRVLLDQLARLRNVYPGATLHDCDDGSDVRPVRLGSTALGRTAARPSAQVEPEPEPEPEPKPEAEPPAPPQPAPEPDAGLAPAPPRTKAPAARRKPARRNKPDH